MVPKSADGDKDEPSLQLPALALPGLRRRKKVKEPPPSEPETTQEPPPEDETPTAVQPPVEQPTEETRRTEQQAERQAEPRAEPAHDEHETPQVSRDQSRRGFVLPAVSGMVAAIVTGVLVGVLGTGLTYLALAGCELAKGTSTCGGPGFFLLLAIVIVMILAGAALLKAWRITDPGSTSFLAVGLVAMIILVVLIEVIFSGWMFLVVPVVSAAAYSLSHWVTTRFVDDESAGVGPDVR